MTTEVIWYGHAAIGIKTAGHFLLVDPYLKGNSKASEKPENLSPNYILITHGHGDHVGDASEIAKRTGATVISNSEIASWFDKKGVKSQGQPFMGNFRYPFGDVKLTMALHGSTLPDGSYGGNPCGFLITTLDHQKIYLAGDTGLFGDMALLGEEGLTLAFLPIGGHFTMDADDALRAVKMLKPKVAVPIHFNTFDAIQQDPQQWADRVIAETTTQVKVLKPRDSFTL